MNALYNFVTGPMVWIAFGVFILGSLVDLVRFFYLSKTRDPEILRFYSLKYGLRSILFWLIPFKARSWRKSPFLTSVTFVFHVCVLLVPIFLSAHVILLDFSWDITYWTLPNPLADILTLLVIACLIVLLARRLLRNNLRYLSSFQDWLTPILVLLPFITGFLAYHQFFYYQPLLILHVITGEILLMSIPFTRLNHILYAPFLRAYIGSEFGGIRKARDW